MRLWYRQVCSRCCCMPAVPLVRLPSWSGCCNTTSAPPSFISIPTSFLARSMTSARRKANAMQRAWDFSGLTATMTISAGWRLCFSYRLKVAALQAKELGLAYFTTTLASSRWKSLEQITEAGLRAQAAVPGTTFWAQNWRKGGLQDRRNQLLREYAFYNQQYCGCEFSMRVISCEFSAEGKV